VRRAAYPGPWLPEPVVARLDDPAERVTQRQEVSLALLVVMEKLTPEQRVAVVLHDAFGVPFDEIAAVLGTTDGAARQHASRGRRAIAAGRARHTADRAEQRRVLEAFLTAAGRAVLAPEVVAVSDGGGVVSAATRPVAGADRVARLYAGLFRRGAAEVDDLTVQPVLVNGDVGLVIRGRFQDGRSLRSVVVLTVADGRVTAVYNQLDPAKLRSLLDAGLLDDG
jgi:RNA polymerase sigma-70 factor (ECF subfamily)